MTNVMDSLLDANLLKQLKANTIVKGTVSEIRSNEVAVDIGAKAEGIIPASEFLNFDELSVPSPPQMSGLKAGIESVHPPPWTRARHGAGRR